MMIIVQNTTLREPRFFAYLVGKQAYQVPSGKAYWAPKSRTGNNKVLARGSRKGEKTTLAKH
jgi:hypothetical protein